MSNLRLIVTFLIDDKPLLDAQYKQRHVKTDE